MSNLLSGLEKFDTESDEASSPTGEDPYEKSYRIMKDAMSNVKQEILIFLPDGTSHIVFVTSIKASKDNPGELEILFCTPSENRKKELYDHVYNCVQKMYEMSQDRKKDSWIKRLARLLW